MLVDVLPAVVAVAVEEVAMASMVLVGVGVPMLLSLGNEADCTLLEYISKYLLP